MQLVTLIGDIVESKPLVPSLENKSFRKRNIEIEKGSILRGDHPAVLKLGSCWESLLYQTTAKLKVAHMIAVPKDSRKVAE